MTGQLVDQRDAPNVFKLIYCLLYLLIRVTSHEQLSLTEFSGEKAKPKVYKDSHINVLGNFWFDWELKVKYSTILIFKVILLCQKSVESF